MKMPLCFYIFVGSLIQISCRNENMNKMVSASAMSLKSGKFSKMAWALTSNRVEEQKTNFTERRLRISTIGKNEMKKRKKMSVQQRRKRSIGSVKVRGFLKPKDDDDTFHSAPPSLVALVFLDIIAGLFTFNAIAALLFVANS